MRLGKLGGALVPLLVLLIASCASPPPLPEPEWSTLDQYDFNVAEADHGLVIPAAHLYEKIYFSRAVPEGGLVNDSIITYRLDSLLIDTLVGLTTSEYDLRQHWLRFMDYRETVNSWLRNKYWNERFGEQIQIDSQDVVDYYNEHPDMFTRLEQAEIYHILSSPLGFLGSQDSALYFGFTRQGLVDYADDYIWELYDLIKYGEAFENVARRYSHDVESRDVGGRLGWVVPGTYVDPFDSVAFSLRNGEVSLPYEDDNGWHILYRTNYIPGGPVPLDSPGVYNRAASAAFDQEVGRLAPTILDSMRSVAKIEVNDLFLGDTDVMAVDDTVWAAIVNQTDTVYFRSMKLLADDFGIRMRMDLKAPITKRAMMTTVTGPLLVQQAAMAAGYDTLPEFREYRNYARHTAVKRIRITNLYGSREWLPTEKQIEDYYNKHWDDYHPRNHIRAEQIITHDLELANFLHDQAGQGMKLPDLLAVFGPDGEGYDITYEDLGIVKEGTLPKKLEEALNLTHAFHVTPVIEGPRGYHFAKVLDRDYEKTLGMVEGAIRTTLVDQHRWDEWHRFRDELFKKEHVRFPGKLQPFHLPRLSERDHPRTIPE